jgi:hypothetical protein
MGTRESGGKSKEILRPLLRNRQEDAYNPSYTHFLEREKMYRLLGIAATFVLLASTAEASGVSLLCGLTTVIINLDEKSVIMKEPELDWKTNDQKTKSFKDAHKYQDGTQQFVQYVRISEYAVNFGQARNDGQYKEDHRIDRQTGVFLRPTGYGSPSGCSLLPPKALF